MGIDTTIAGMTVAEKVGQMFMLAFAGRQMDEARILMQEHKVGGAYISDDNVPTAAAATQLCNTLQSFAAETRLGIPLLLGADQEGTWSVMTAESAMGPGNMALGATGDPECAYAMYGVIAREASAVGLNVVLGPAADCNSNPHNSIIGMRAFGEQPALVAGMTAAALRGLQEHGSIGALKHFPGHGDTTVDSHRGLPTVSRSREELRRIDLQPFAAGIAAGAKIVMTSHIIFSAFDRERPATLSPIILGDLLRGELGFDGVILSDSMNMHSMKRNYAPADAVIRGFQAGVDLMMLAEEHYDHDAGQYLENQRALIRAVIAAVERGHISAARVDDAVGRVLRLKRDAGWTTAPRPATELVGSAAHRAIELDCARRALCIVRDDNQLLPLDSAAPLTVVNTSERAAYEVLTGTRGIGPNQALPAFDVFMAALRASCPSLEAIAAEDFDADTLPSAGVIVAVTENYTLPGMDFDMAQQARIVGALQAAAPERLLVLGLREPYELAQFPQLRSYVCAFSFRPCAAQAAAELLLGQYEAGGQSPVTVPGTELSAREL